MNPTAFMRPSTDSYDSAFRDAWTIETSADGDWSEWIPLFSADQLRQAKVEVLREAARKMIGLKDEMILYRMADELEKT